MHLFQLAWRNLWRNPRRTAVTIGAMTFALWVMILYSGLITGNLRGMEADLLDYEMGDVQIHAQGFHDDPSIYARIADSDAVVSKIEAAGFRATPRLLAGGLVAIGDASAGAQLRGIDVAREDATLRLREKLATGEWLDPADANGVVLGRRLARALGAKVGDELLVLSQDADGGMANDLYRVRGILGPVADGTDRTAVLMPVAAWRALFSVPDGAHQIVVRRPVDLPLDQFKSQLVAIDGVDQVQTWRELMPMVAQMMDAARNVVYFVFVIVYIAIGILILNAMLMAVFERIREFGVLKAIGVGPGTVFGLIVVESALQAAISVVLGVVLALPVAWWLAVYGLDVGSLGGTAVMGMAMRPVWYGIFEPATFAGPIGVLLVIVTGAILYPALKAAFIRPLDAMRYQ